MQLMPVQCISRLSNAVKLHCCLLLAKVAASDIHMDSALQVMSCQH
jgi:hypothetical protein